MYIVGPRRFIDAGELKADGRSCCDVIAESGTRRILLSRDLLASSVKRTSLRGLMDNEGDIEII
jgi:hypothetical protein